MTDDELIHRTLTGQIRRDIAQATFDKKCVRCEQPATTFTDDLSAREYHTSGLCQACQDIFFKEN